MEATRKGSMPGRPGRRQQEQHAIAEALSGVGFALPGSVQARRTRARLVRAAAATPTPPEGTAPTSCGPAKSPARPPPYVLTEAQLADYQPWFDNARRLRELVSQLHTLSLQAFEEDDPSRDT
ncbi:MAG: DUF6788 family protein [Egibacteraceae bacterium]